MGGDATPVIPSFSSQTIANMLDGIYDIHKKNCYYGKRFDLDDPLYLRIDLGAVKKVSRVTYTTQHDGKLRDKLIGLEIWVGNTSTSDILDGLAILGRNIPEPTELNKEISPKLEGAAYGRFVVIYKTEGELLRLCHLEVF